MGLTKKIKSGLIQSLKTLTIIEKLISILSLVIGLILSYESIYLIYAYNFSSILFLFMIPMTSLISNLIIGLFLIYSSLNLISSNKRTTFFYKLTGILIMLHPINLNLLDYFKNDWTIRSLFILILIPFGSILYIVFNQKKYKSSEQTLTMFRYDIVKVTIGLFTFLLIDLFFWGWNYLDRIL